MKKTILLFAGLAFLTFKNQAQTTVTDIDGNVYNTVTIGTQVWMKENLKVTHYNNGNLIPNISGTSWNNLPTGARCYYNNDSIANAPIYGVLYNWYVVDDSRKLCPIDWHVPVDTEWTILTTYLGGENIAGGKLKDTLYWGSPNTGATNETGFTALPGGYRNSYGPFDGNSGYYGIWWSSTEQSTTNAFDRDMYKGSSSVGRMGNNKSFGFSVRCIKDDIGTGQNENDPKNNFEVYPNPTIDRVIININDIQNASLQIYNTIGKCVMQKQLANNTNEIDISSLSKGIYIVRLTGTDGTYQQKLIKE